MSISVFQNLSLYKYPFVIVSELPTQFRHLAIEFLNRLQVPVLLEATSGIREEASLQEFRIKYTDKFWDKIHISNYPIDCVIRIGGVPTTRVWRDLESRPDIPVISISHLPFTGLSHNKNPVIDYFEGFKINLNTQFPLKLKELDEEINLQICQLLAEEPYAEPSLIHALSQNIASNATVYLGNSMPIRQWDAFATTSQPHSYIYANRGANGIDGQISTFLGLATDKSENWGIIGDLTTLYDMAGFWILSQLNNIHMNLVIINNSGGKIFERLFDSTTFFNEHSLSFEALAKMWHLKYQKIVDASDFNSHHQQIIECLPDLESTKRFWNKYSHITEKFLIKK